ncbi:MAG: ThuA domain-containing protein [Ruminococcaceae bacterium]|nr:ThuA domain-containing protein [Oscillospiraceae bacterium]
MKKFYFLTADYYHPDTVLRPGLEAAFGTENCVYVNDPAEIPWDTLSQDAAFLLIAKMDDYSSQLGHPRYEELFAPEADWMRPEWAAALERYVSEGGGFIALHSGTLWHEDSDMARLTGGYFLRHPPQCNVRVVPTIEHPITEGVEPFTANDEYYMCRVYGDHVKPLALAWSPEPQGEPTVVAAWCREVAWGRVAVLTPGHTLDAILNPNMTRLLQNAAKWVTKTC